MILTILAVVFVSMLLFGVFFGLALRNMDRYVQLLGKRQEKSK